MSQTTRTHGFAISNMLKALFRPAGRAAPQSLCDRFLPTLSQATGMVLTVATVGATVTTSASAQVPAAPQPDSVMVAADVEGEGDAMPVPFPEVEGTGADAGLPDGIFTQQGPGDSQGPSSQTVIDPATGEALNIDEAYSDIEMQELDQAVDAAEILDVSAKPADWTLDQPVLEEMPYSASSGNWFNDGRWYASGESLWLDRSRAYRRTIAIDTALLPPPPYDPSNIDDYPLRYTTVSKPFNVAPGARATIGRSLGRDYLNRDRAFEFTYYGGMTYEQTDGWNALGDAAGDNTLLTPLALRVPGYNGAGFYTTAFNSDFNSYEWNFKMRRRLGRDKMVMMPNGDWSRHSERAFLPAGFVGVRLANVNEDFFWQSGRQGVDFSEFGGVYQVHTENWLLGMNFGGELISQNEFFWWGIRGRAAPCLSFASENQSNISNNTIDATFAEGSQNWTASDTTTGPAFLGDLSLMAGFNLTPNFSFKAGYEFLWVAGIATATRQFNLDQRRQDPIDAGGQTFYQGLSFGFEGTW